MKYLLSIFRISLLIAVVLALGRFGDIKKTRAAGNPDPTNCTGTGPIFDCTVTSGSSIPASYEGQNIIINGAITINVDEVQVWQTDGTHLECPATLPTGEEYKELNGTYCEYHGRITGPVATSVAHSVGNICTDALTLDYVLAEHASPPNCDSKRHFTSLKIINGGVLTHNAPVPVTDFSTTAPYSLTPTGQLKKVDLIIDNDLTLESGGSINVDGKGYPRVTGLPDGYGPGYGLRGQCPDGAACGGGGGYGGKGGQGNSPSLIGGPTYGSALEPVDFGSAAGFASGQLSYAGGRIKVIANSIKITDLSSKITANGTDQLGWDSQSPGGASGGSIWLLANTINTPAARLNTPSDYAMADKGYHRDTSRGSDGFVGTLVINGTLKDSGSSNNPSVPSYTNIFAKGGDINRNGGAGGGGRIVIGPGGGTSQVRKVHVKVKWDERGAPQFLDFYENLSNITPITP